VSHPEFREPRAYGTWGRYSASTPATVATT